MLSHFVMANSEDLGKQISCTDSPCISEVSECVCATKLLD